MKGASFLLVVCVLFSLVLLLLLLMLLQLLLLLLLLTLVDVRGQKAPVASRPVSSARRG